jgi:hypothetical protein
VSDARRERPDAGSQTPLGLRGQDEDIAHEIYHDDAVLEFPNPANGSKAWKTSGNGAASTLLT